MPKICWGCCESLDVRLSQGSLKFLAQTSRVATTSHQYCVRFICCRSDELSSRSPLASLVYQVLTSKILIWPTIFISPQKVLLAASGHLWGESAFTRRFGDKYFAAAGPRIWNKLPVRLSVGKTRKSAAQNSEDNWKHSCFTRTAMHSDFFDYPEAEPSIAPDKIILLLTYLLIVGS